MKKIIVRYNIFDIILNKHGNKGLKVRYFSIYQIKHEKNNRSLYTK